MKNRFFSCLLGIPKRGLIVLLSLLSIVFTSTTVFAYAGNAQTTPSAIALLKHTPSGNANMIWNAEQKTLIVKLNMTGLQPKSIHPAHIHAGTCSSDGKILYTLENVVADTAGNATSTTVISNITTGIPATGWYINVHAGPTLNTPAEALPIACGNVSNPSTAATVTVPLAETTSPNQAATGNAELNIVDGSLVVTTTVTKLVPGSSHAAHIHAGSCASQIPGTVLYPLTTLVADNQGVARSVTTIVGVKSIPASGWHINVHFSTDLSTQAGYDPIVCGDVVVK